MQLTNVVARKILNSRKEATIEVVAEANGNRVTASAPSGASKGKHEVKDISSRGIDFSISFLDVLGRKLVNEKISFESFEDLEKIEALVRQYDKTPQLEFVGGNSLYSIENAVLKLLALSQKQDPWKFLLQDKRAAMPMPLGNCIGGGMHVRQPNKTDFQEFLLMPKTRSFFDACFISLQAYKEIGKMLEKKDKRWKGVLTDEKAFY
jgi:enolase